MADNKPVAEHGAEFAFALSTMTASRSARNLLAYFARIANRKRRVGCRCAS